jgi:hypothetical protein
MSVPARRSTPRTRRWLFGVLIAGAVHVSLLPNLYAIAPARGLLAGKVFDKTTQELVPYATIDAYALTSGEEFRMVTDASGGYSFVGAPSGVYAFSLSVNGTDYVVQERLDVRVGIPFLLESCFELDGEQQTAHVRAECDSGFVEEARVATIGPHRFLRPESPLAPLNQTPQDPAPQDPQAPSSPSEAKPDGTPPAAQGETDIAETALEEPDLPSGDSGGSDVFAPDTILHDELVCLTYEHFPVVDANIAPGEAIAISRVYFRSDKYPDFYYVDMGPENPTLDDFRAVLPKPSPETERIFYYVESIDNEFDSMQTEEYDPPVLEVQDCKDRGAVWFQGEDPNIIVGATTGLAAALPPGFQVAGITGFVSSLGVVTTVGGVAAAGGGIASTTGLVLVVAGGTAAATGTTIAVTGDKEASEP